jgi:hypothetical protein
MNLNYMLRWKRQGQVNGSGKAFIVTQIFFIVIEIPCIAQQSVSREGFIWKL